MTLLNEIIWNADPAIFSIFGKEIRWYGLFFAIAFALGLLMTGKAFKDEKVPDSWTDSIFVYIIIITFIFFILYFFFFVYKDIMVIMESSKKKIIPPPVPNNMTIVLFSILSKRS